jgi:hypothetical protein
MRVEAGEPRKCGRGKGFFFFFSVPTGAGVHLTTYSMVRPTGHLPWGKMDGARSRLFMCI